jgi:hypothetical protein
MPPRTTRPAPERTAADEPGYKEERDLARVQSAATDPGARLPAGEAAVERKPGLYVPLISTDEDGREIAREEFRLSEFVNAMALMEWAAAGDGGDDENTAFENLKAAYHVLEAIVARDEFPAFKRYARDPASKIGFKELVDFQNAAFEVLSANPTR